MSAGVTSKLGVNLDHVATLRQLRGTPYPDLLQAARIVERAGGNQITVHLREDRRHIQDGDVRLLRRKLRVPLNLEMATSEEIIRIAIKLRPDWTCLVPEKRQEVTTEGGLDLATTFHKTGRAITRLKKAGIRVSLFVEPKLEAVRRSAELGADAVEFHTGRYCLAAQRQLGRLSRTIERQELIRLRQAAELARLLGLHPHAGHGFDYDNVGPVARLRTKTGVQLIDEFNIGHAIICQAVSDGLERAVRKMIAAIRAN